MILLLIYRFSVANLDYFDDQVSVFYLINNSIGFIPDPIESLLSLQLFAAVWAWIFAKSFYQV